MGKKKDALSVEEARQQFKDFTIKIQPKQYLVKNIRCLTLASFVLGMVSADSVKTRENFLSLVVSVLKTQIGWLSHVPKPGL